MSGRVWTGILMGLAVVGLAVLGSVVIRSGLRGRKAPPKPPSLPVEMMVGDFRLVDGSGETLARSDLLGRVWIADFIFTRCAGPCPLMTSQMYHLQSDLGPEVHLVSFTVDPEYDTPEILSQYASDFGAEEGRWSFLTGDREEIYDLARKSLKLTVEDPEEGIQILHDMRFVLVDRKGQIRGYYSSKSPDDLERIRVDAAALVAEGAGIIPLRLLPTVNAALNGICAILLVSGYLMIRRKKVAAHRACMLSAFGTSALFLTSYLYYHFHHGGTPFSGEGWIRPVYFSILLSHTVLAIAVVPLVLLTLFAAVRERFDRHRRIARWTLPIWLYISVTGVIIYVMLYHLYGG